VRGTGNREGTAKDNDRAPEDRDEACPASYLRLMPDSVVRATLFTDPGCPWAYSARPALARLIWRFGDQIEWRLVLIGLSETTERYASIGYTPARQATGWATFQRRFGMPFGRVVKPGLAPTTRACRAIIAAREIDADLGEAALLALQLLQFTTTGLLDSDDDLRAALARVDSLDADAVVASIDDPAIVSLYEADKALARSAEGTPIEVQGRHSTSDGPVRYTAPSVIFEHDEQRADVGGFQPFESYDNALANLVPALERRPAPSDPAEAVAAFPHGVTTAEVAMVMRPTDLAEEDIAETHRQLLQLAGDGEVTGEAVGTDALWRPPASATVR
jgi:2-hydroxychromene-2-carboxylate isomerase